MSARLEAWGVRCRSHYAEILALQCTQLVLGSNQIIFGDAEVIRSKTRVAGRFEQAIVFGRDCTISVCPGGAVVCSMEHDISLAAAAAYEAISPIGSNGGTVQSAMLRRHR
jgi:hypothetical protein